MATRKKKIPRKVKAEILKCAESALEIGLAKGSIGWEDDATLSHRKRRSLYGSKIKFRRKIQSVLPDGWRAYLGRVTSDWQEGSYLTLLLDDPKGSTFHLALDSTGGFERESK